VNYGVGSVVYTSLAPGRVDASLVVSQNCATRFIGGRGSEFFGSNVRSTRSEALAYIVRRYPALAWKEDGKMIRLTDSTARPDLLAVRIKELSVLHVREMYQLSLALENSGEVQEFMKKSNAEFMHPTSYLSSGTVNLRPDGTVEYSSGTTSGSNYHFKDTTVAEILDQVVVATSGMWSYEECEWKGRKEIGLSLDRY
jgi:hypothetical protein